SYKRAVDLDAVEREAAQVEQARIAGAEIIERETHAERFEAVHRLLGFLDVAEQSRLGEFELQPLRVESGVGENALDDLDEILPAELERRYVHREREALPRCRLEAGLAQYPLAERDDEFATFGDRDEVAR